MSLDQREIEFANEAWEEGYQHVVRWTNDVLSETKIKGKANLRLTAAEPKTRNLAEAHERFKRAIAPLVMLEPIPEVEIQHPWLVGRQLWTGMSGWDLGQFKPILLQLCTDAGKWQKLVKDPIRTHAEVWGRYFRHCHRHAGGAEQRKLDLQFDSGSRMVQRDGFPKKVAFLDSPLLWRLCCHFADAIGTPVSMHDLKTLWEETRGSRPEDSTIRNTLSMLRQRLCPLGLALTSHRGTGWVLDEKVEIPKPASSGKCRRHGKKTPRE